MGKMERNGLLDLNLGSSDLCSSLWMLNKVYFLPAQVCSYLVPEEYLSPKVLDFVLDTHALSHPGYSSIFFHMEKVYSYLDCGFLDLWHALR